MSLEHLAKATEKIFATELRFLPDIKSAIRKRYEITFEDIWLDEAAQLENARITVRCPEIEAICERAFESTLNQTKSHELAAIVCDDFDLFCTAVAIGHSTPFLCALWKSYTLGNFPTAATSETNTLSEMIRSHSTSPG